MLVPSSNKSSHQHHKLVNKLSTTSVTNINVTNMFGTWLSWQRFPIVATSVFPVEHVSSHVDPLLPFFPYPVHLAVPTPPTILELAI